MLDEIIKWTGWFIAVAMTVWKIVETLRNRPKIKFFIGLSKEENQINLTVMNIGRRPINLIGSGLQFPDGFCYSFPHNLPQALDIYYGWLYYANED